MTFLLVTYVDKPVIDAHLKLGGRFIVTSLFFIKLFEALKS
jgi:hypothetical protein